MPVKSLPQQYVQSQPGRSKYESNYNASVHTSKFPTIKPTGFQPWLAYSSASRGASSSYSSSPSETEASWYCWYSETKSFMLDSASVNSISSIPSPVYQCKKALRLNMAVNWSPTRLNSSWIE